MFPLNGFYHFGIVASDFDRTIEELSENLGLEWASVTEFEMVCEQPNGIVTADMKVVYSITGPPHFEVIRVAPGTVWGEADLGVHHLGYWTENLQDDHKRLTDEGYVWEATYYNSETEGPFGFTYHTLSDTRLRLELVDIARKPAFDKWMAGGDFPSAMEPGGMQH
jgi:hypothetical protein